MGLCEIERLVMDLLVRFRRIMWVKLRKVFLQYLKSRINAMCFAFETEAFALTFRKLCQEKDHNLVI